MTRSAARFSAGMAARAAIAAAVLFSLAGCGSLVLATAYRLFPDSAAARGEPAGGGEEVASAQQIAFARLIPGVHW